MSMGVPSKWLILATIIFFGVVLVGCSVPSGSSGTPSVIQFPKVDKSDWVATISSVCIQVEQSYPGVIGRNEPIAKELQGILERIGVKTTLGDGNDCQAVLQVMLQVTPVKSDYAGSRGGCYTGAEAAGQATFSSTGQKTLTLKLSEVIYGSQVITECPSTPKDAPLKAAWTGAILPMLSEWWGSPALVSALKTEDFTLQWAAANQLQQLGPAASDAIPVLVEMLSDALPRNRKAAAEALGKIGPAASQAVPALIEATKDAENNVRFEAVTALGGIGEDPALAALVEILHHNEAYMRYKAAEALQKLGPKAVLAVPELIEAFSDPENQVRDAAIMAVGAIGPEAKAAIPILIDLLAVEDPSAHAYAEAALKNITGQNFKQDPNAWRLWWEAQP